MSLWHSRILALVLALGAVACTGPSDETVESTGPQLERRSADAPRAATEAPANFAFLRYAISVDGDTPEVCLGFTQHFTPGSSQGHREV